MSKFLLLLMYISNGIVIFFFPTMSFIYYIKKRCLKRLIFFVGLLMTGVGTLIQIFSPVHKASFDEAGNILSGSGIQFSWYIGNVTTSLGLIMITIGFFLFVFEK